jgi:hypothetical protein
MVEIVLGSNSIVSTFVPDNSNKVFDQPLEEPSVIFNDGNVEHGPERIDPNVSPFFRHAQQIQPTLLIVHNDWLIEPCFLQEIFIFLIIKRTDHVCTHNNLPRVITQHHSL